MNAYFIGIVINNSYRITIIIIIIVLFDSFVLTAQTVVAATVTL